jgi:hypothetical protein
MLDFFFHTQGVKRNPYGVCWERKKDKNNHMKGFGVDMGWEGEDWTNVAQDRYQWPTCEQGSEIQELS